MFLRTKKLVNTRFSIFFALYLLLLLWFVVSQKKTFLPADLPLNERNSESRNASDWFHHSEDDLKWIQTLAQDDKELINYVRHHVLIPPVPFELKYNLSQPNQQDPSMGQAGCIRDILEDKEGGFFVECGALDGETRSNTLYFERFLNWKGLLVEADPENFKLVLAKNRKAWLAPTCLSLKRKPSIVNFYQASNLGKIMGSEEETDSVKFVKVLCIPFTTLLLATGVKRIDYFSLDVEGNELDVLKTIDFSRFDIRTLSVEYLHDKEGKNAIRNFMEEAGYSVHSVIVRRLNRANDFIFIKNGPYSFNKNKCH